MLLTVKLALVMNLLWGKRTLPSVRPAEAAGGTRPCWFTEQGRSPAPEVVEAFPGLGGALDNCLVKPGGTLRARRIRRRIRNPLRRIAPDTRRPARRARRRPGRRPAQPDS